MFSPPLLSVRGPGCLSLQAGIRRRAQAAGHSSAATSGAWAQTGGGGGGRGAGGLRVTAPAGMLQGGQAPPQFHVTRLGPGGGPGGGPGPRGAAGVVVTARGVTSGRPWADRSGGGPGGGPLSVGPGGGGADPGRAAPLSGVAQGASAAASAAAESAASAELPPALPTCGRGLTMAVHAAAMAVVDSVARQVRRERPPHSRAAARFFRVSCTPMPEQARLPIPISLKELVLCALLSREKVTCLGPSCDMEGYDMDHIRAAASYRAEHGFDAP